MYIFLTILSDFIKLNQLDSEQPNFSLFNVKQTVQWHVQPVLKNLVLDYSLSLNHTCLMHNNSIYPSSWSFTAP